MIEWIRRRFGKLAMPVVDREKEIESARSLHREVLLDRKRVLQEFRTIERRLR